MRTWSWKYSRCRRFGGTVAACRWIAGPQWPENGTCCAAASAATRSHSVMPPHRPISACRTSTAPAVEHGLEVVEVVAVLARRDVERQRFDQAAQPGQVVGTHRLLEPADAEVARELATRAGAPACAS